MQPRPKPGRWTADLEQVLAANAAKPAREQPTLIRIFEELRGRGYDSGYDAVRRYAGRWAKQYGQAGRSHGATKMSRRMLCGAPDQPAQRRRFRVSNLLGDLLKC